MKNFALGAMAFLVTTVIYPVVVRADDGLREGKWEMTTVIDKTNQGMPNMPASQGSMHVDVQNGVENVTTNNGSFSAPVQDENIPNFKMGDSHMDMNGSNMNLRGTYTICITPDNRIPIKRMPNCEEPQVNISGNTMDIHVICNMEGMGQMDQTSHVVYTDDTADIVSNTHLTGKNGFESNMKAHVTGRYLGPC